MENPNSRVESLFSGTKAHLHERGVSVLPPVLLPSDKAVARPLLLAHGWHYKAQKHTQNEVRPKTDNFFPLNVTGCVL